MIEKIHINKYRKFENIDFEFSKNINIISGANGTCKTSLLHIVSNNFQKLKQDTSNPTIKDIFTVNNQVNPTIETLTKGDSEYNDPAQGVVGTLLTIQEFGKIPIEFRRHKTSSDSEHQRFRLIPKYPAHSGQKKTSLPVVYLGLKRLYPYGEIADDTPVKKISSKISTNLFDEVAELYNNFTHSTLNTITNQQVANIKKRANFKTSVHGIDSNTISSGEDNLFIILTGLVSLKKYYETLPASDEPIKSILLIDELDATLHPAYQVKLLDLFKRFSQDYKIQIFFTTHSMTLVDESLNDSTNCKVFYLIDNISRVDIMDEPDKFKIEQDLRNLSRVDIYTPSVIPVFSEDSEARLFIEKTFDFISQNDSGFSSVRNLFHLVDCKIGSSNLTTIFQDDKILKPTLRSICILDGDQQPNLANHITKLPGTTNPEEIIFNFSEALFNDQNSNFWTDTHIVTQGWSKRWYQDNLQSRINSITAEFSQKEGAGESVHGFKRAKYKDLFNDNSLKPFIICLIQKWVNEPANLPQIKTFVNDLFVLFHKVARYHSINPSEWSQTSPFFARDYNA
ncbi:MAG: AAA family ATPase [Candidatus Ancillula sp.]|jgi:hypothetical protein|nr:AAA family ATPase [Candidatus Ancillula sp.]